MAEVLETEGAAENPDPVSGGIEVVDEDDLAVHDTDAGGEGSRADRRTGREVMLVCANSIRPQPISWVWDGWLAAGKFHVLAGQPGTGKTTIALSFAATISRGSRWPDGSSVQPANVLLWSGEDDPADTLIPRLLAMGADLSRVHIVGDVREGVERRSFDPARDMAALERETSAIGGSRLLVVDPVVSVVAGDSHKNAETRKALQPLVDLAARLDCVVLGITHLTKGTIGREPIERVTGSLAFGALARVVMIAAKVSHEADENTGGRILARAKSNIGRDTGGCAYELQEVELPSHPGLLASRVAWVGAISGSARQLLADAEPSPAPANGEEPAQSMTDEAIELLKAVLGSGAVHSKEVKHLATEAGISPKALRTARDRLQVRVDRDGFGVDTKTYWGLPESPLVPSAASSAQQIEVASMGDEGTSVICTLAQLPEHEPDSVPVVAANAQGAS